MAKVWNKRDLFSIKEQADNASKVLAKEKGACPDASDYGVQERFSNKIAIAPTASISNYLWRFFSRSRAYCNKNSFTQKTLSGSFNVRNPILKQSYQKRKRYRRSLIINNSKQRFCSTFRISR